MSHDEADEDTHPIEGVFTDVFKASIKPPVFILRDLLPAGLVIMAGPPKKAMKSTITMAAAALVAGLKCRALPGEWTRVGAGGPVMVFSYEADAGELHFILREGLGVRPGPDNAIIIADEPDKYRLDDEDAVETLVHWMELRRPALVILDPLDKFHSIEEKDSGGMVRILAPLRRWAKKHDTCFLVVHHTRKAGDEDDRRLSQADMRGTSALHGMVDGSLIITPGPKDGVVHINAEFKRAKGWTKTVELGAWERKGLQGGERLQEVDKMCLKAVRHGYDSAVKVAKHLNMALKNVEVRVLKLTTNGLLRCSKQGRLSTEWREP